MNEADKERNRETQRLLAILEDASIEMDEADFNLISERVLAYDERK